MLSFARLYTASLFALVFLGLLLPTGALATPWTVSNGSGRLTEAGEAAISVVAGQEIPVGASFHAGDLGAAFAPFAGGEVFLGPSSRVVFDADSERATGLKVLSGAVSYAAREGAPEGFSIAVSTGWVSVASGVASVLVSGSSVRVSAVSGVVWFTASGSPSVRVPVGSVLGVTQRETTLTDLAAKKVRVLGADGRVQSTRDASAADLQLAQAATGLVPLAEGPAVAGAGASGTGGVPAAGAPLLGSPLLGSPNPANILGNVNSPAQ